MTERRLLDPAHWQALQRQAERLGAGPPLPADAARASEFALRVGPLYASFARQRLDATARDALFALAREAGLPGAIRSLVEGELVNSSEGRPALHTALRSDLGFFERLIPGSGTDALSIRGLQAERVSDTQLRWQVLMMQASKNAPDFKGTLEITFAGTLAGKPWTAASSPGPQPVLIKGYLRMEGMVDVPAQAVVKNVTAKILQGSSVRSMQSFNL